MEYPENVAICPGCGTTYKDKLPRSCGVCGWEVNYFPFRLLSLHEIAQEDDQVYSGLRLDLFLKSLTAFAGLTLREYHERAEGTSGAFGSGTDRRRQEMNALALAGEVGELCNLLKKRAGHGHDIPDEQMLDELGDVLWYVAEIAASFGENIEEVARRNLEKLASRYPDGFSQKDSRERK